MVRGDRSSTLRRGVSLGVGSALVAGLCLASCTTADATSGVTPAKGAQAGGYPLRVQGSDFLGHGSLVVYVGDRSAKGVIIESPTSVRVTAPESEDVGTVSVVLRFSDGTERTFEDAFTFEEQPGFVVQPRIGGGVSMPSPVARPDAAGG